MIFLKTENYDRALNVPPQVAWMNSTLNPAAWTAQKDTTATVVLALLGIRKAAFVSGRKQKGMGRGEEEGKEEEQRRR